MYIVPLFSVLVTFGLHVNQHNDHMNIWFVCRRTFLFANLLVILCSVQDLILNDEKLENLSEMTTELKNIVK